MGPYNIEYLQKITKDLNNLAKTRFVSYYDMAIALGFTYSDLPQSEGWISDQNGKTHICFRVWNTPANRKLYAEDIVADDDNYIYVQNDGEIGKWFDVK